MKYERFMVILIVSALILCSSLTVCFAQENLTSDLSKQPLNDVQMMQATNGTVGFLDQSIVEEANGSEILSASNEQALSHNDEGEVLSVSDTSSYQGIIDTCTVKDRTFKIGKYSVTISKTRFANLYTARDVEDYYWSQGGPDTFEWGDKIGDFSVGVSGVHYEFEVPTKKFVKQKIGYGYKGDKLTKLKSFKSKAKALKYKKTLIHKYDLKIKKKHGKYVVYKVTSKYKKIVTKKARVYVMFTYGPSQNGAGNYKYTISLNTKYQNPGYDIVKGWLGKYRVTSNVFALKTAKIRIC